MIRREAWPCGNRWWRPTQGVSHDRVTNVSMTASHTLKGTYARRKKCNKHARSRSRSHPSKSKRSHIQSLTGSTKLAQWTSLDNWRNPSMDTLLFRWVHATASGQPSVDANRNVASAHRKEIWCLVMREATKRRNWLQKLVILTFNKCEYNQHLFENGFWFVLLFWYQLYIQCFAIPFIGRIVTSQLRSRLNNYK